MRVFIALKLPERVKDNLSLTAKDLSFHSVKGNFVPKENYHVTLHFLGDVDVSDLTFIQSAMDSVRSLPSPTTSITGVTAFRAVDVVCAKMRISNDLTAIHEAVGERLEEYGFTVEHRAYRPHVTLIRKFGFDLPFSEVTKSVNVYNKPFDICELALFESVFENGTVSYRELYTVSLAQN